jgi:hypothetical protein
MTERGLSEDEAFTLKARRLIEGSGVDYINQPGVDVQVDPVVVDI